MTEITEKGRAQQPWTEINGLQPEGALLISKYLPEGLEVSDGAVQLQN